MATKNFAVKLNSRTFGIVAFDVISASSSAAALTAAASDQGNSFSQENLTATRASELLSDTQPDLYGRIASNPGS